MNELHPEEEAIFEAALELPRPARDVFLRATCGEDESLRERIEHLLRGHEQSGILEQSAAVVLRDSLVASPPLAEKPGGRIGRYKLLQQIGEGGCGVVYMAEQEEPVRRRVALKVIKLGMDTKSVIARFEAERQALALMDHPNIAKVLDAGATETGRPYFVMELVRGSKITDYCDQNKLCTEGRLRLFLQACHAIQHAHQKGIIHRDIKPSNILVTLHDGVPVPKVIDFGIAKATTNQRLTDKTVFTAFEQFIGTPAYMSPEQAEMSGLDIDTRSDIYALGVLLYELLTGCTPFDSTELVAQGVEAMRRTLREKDPAPPSRRLSTMREADRTTVAGHHQSGAPKLINLLRGDLDWIVMKCLEKDRTRRYETANGLAMEIQRHLRNEPIGARPPSRMYQLQKLARRNRASLLAAAVVIVALLVTFIALVVSNVRITRERNQKDAALAEKGTALDAARASESNAVEQLFLAMRSHAQARRYSHQMGQRVESLAALAAAAKIRPEEGLRDDAIATLAVPDIGRGPSLPGLPAGATTIAFDDLYQLMAIADGQGVIHVCHRANNQEIQRFDSNGAILPGSMGQTMRFSPHGRFLATLENGDRLRVLRISDGQSVLRAVPRNCVGFTFSPDNRQIAVGQNDWILCFDLPSGEENQRWRVRGVAHHLAFNPDSRKLAVGYANSEVVSLYDTANGSLLADLPVGSVTEQIVAWHPDGQRLAVSGSDPHIQIWDVVAKRKLASLTGHAQQVTALTFHPEGGLLASASWDGIARLWDCASGRQWLQMPVQAVFQFSPDGRWVGYTLDNGQLRLLEITSAPEYRTLVSSLGAGAGGYYSGDISPDGRLLALGMKDGFRLWELAAGRELAFQPTGFTESVFFQADGQGLFSCSQTAGLQQWPIHRTGPTADKLQFGPPHEIKLSFEPIHAAPNWRTLQVALTGRFPGKATVLDLAAETTDRPIVEHPDGGGFVALSPNGQWLATGGWYSDEVRLWNAQSGELIKQWITGRPTRVFFTPDGLELILSRGDEFSFWNVNSLQLTRRLPSDIALYPSYVAFSSDAKLMAMEMSPGVIHLKEITTGRTVAKLEDPFGDRATWMAFSTGGMRLVVAANYASAIHVWDLRALRAHLKPMGLDWDWPEFPNR